MRGQLMLRAAAFLWGAWRRRYLIAVPIVAMPLLGLLVGILSPKKYETYTTILIQEAAKQNPFLQDLTVETNLKSRMEALRALLHSRHILAEVAVRRGLVDDDTPQRERDGVISELSRSLDARLVGDDLVKITHKAGAPEGMEEVLKLVSLRFIERVIAPQRSAIFSSETFLEKEIEKRSKDLTEAETRLAAYKKLHAAELPSIHSANVTRLTRLRETIAERKISLDSAKAARESLRGRLAQTNPVVGRIEEAIVGVMGELAILRARYTDRHTLVQAALRKLRSLEDERAKALAVARALDAEDVDRLWNMVSSRAMPEGATTQPLLVSQLEKLQEADATVRGLEEEVAGLERESLDLETKVAAFGEHERRLGELTRDIAVKRKVYDDLAERHQKARVTGALGRAEENERVKLIDPPFTPTAPSNLPLLAFVVAGLVGGVALGIGLAVAAELLDTTLWRRDSLADLLGVPVLTRIPVLPNDGFATDRDGLDPALFAISNSPRRPKESRHA